MCGIGQTWGEGNEMMRNAYGGWTDVRASLPDCFSIHGIRVLFFDLGDPWNEKVNKFYIHVHLLCGKLWV